ncbi:hypothetical protein FHW36_102673 [Chitinophaga polysaccharea]|uniref:Terpene synthase n=1 Tax=Chitinophaga polysaccharea TaxID=1293035 RepID=A0A561PXR3_9BACT|nr:hypothetical protein [Chitinophaga polysaccharea]TWF42911.1 hypothetical protein FHW36_102673 [Chitinophaga polysaccharea]
MKTQLILRLRYPFPCSVSPHAPFVENEVQKWIEEYTCLPKALLNRYRHSRFGGLGPRFFPQASLDRLIPLSRFFLWIFAHDDFFGPWSPGELRQISQEALAILEGESVVRNNEIMKQLALFSSELVSYVTPVWRKRFIEHMADYFKAMEDEQSYNHGKLIAYPSVESYMVLRTRTSAMFAVTDLLEIAMNRILPPFVLDHPDIQRLILLTNRFTAWSNDCLSLARERGLEATNLVLIIQHANKCSLEEAIEATIAQHDHDIQAFMTIRSSLPDFGVWQQAVEEYIQGLEWMAAGHLDWYNYTMRYEESSAERVI